MGKARESQGPSPYRLNVVFMAAAPRGAENLDFENEEVELLDATRDMGLDLSVEESGTLGLLAKRVAVEQPDVLHISCHGRLHPKPLLQLEDDTGDLGEVTPQELLDKLSGTIPRLVFTSACETAQTDPG